MCLRLDTIPECERWMNGRTDVQTDGFAEISRSACIAWWHATIIIPYTKCTLARQQRDISRVANEANTDPRSQPSHSSSRSSRSALPHTSQNVLSGSSSSSTCISWWLTGICRYTTPSQPSRTRIRRKTWRSTGHVLTFYSIYQKQSVTSQSVFPCYRRLLALSNQPTLPEFTPG